MKYFAITPQDVRDMPIVHNVLSRIGCIEYVEGNVYRSVGFHSSDIVATLRLHGVVVSVVKVEDGLSDVLHSKKGFQLI